MNDAMAPDEFEEQLLTIRETVNPKTERIYQMHMLVVDLLIELGYEVGAEIYADDVIER